MSDSSPATKPNVTADNSDDRRGFIRRSLSVVFGGLIGLVPLVAGAIPFLDPLLRKTKKGKGEPVFVTTLAAMPEVGKLYRFAVIDERVDAWSLHPGQPIGSILMKRPNEKDKPVAFTTVCPHLGCSVEVKGDAVRCPCHNSAWDMDGNRLNAESSPSPRDLDPLEVELRDEGEVWVAYQSFRSGVSARIAEDA